MAYSTNKKPGELTALTSLATDDVIIVGDTSDASEVAKGITKANNGNIYLAKGVTSAADWVQVNN